MSDGLMLFILNKDATGSLAALGDVKTPQQLAMRLQEASEVYVAPALWGEHLSEIRVGQEKLDGIGDSGSGAVQFLTSPSEIDTGLQTLDLVATQHYLDRKLPTSAGLRLVRFDLPVALSPKAVSALSASLRQSSSRASANNPLNLLTGAPAMMCLSVALDEGSTESPMHAYVAMLRNLVHRHKAQLAGARLAPRGTNLTLSQVMDSYRSRVLSLLKEDGKLALATVNMEKEISGVTWGRHIVDKLRGQATDELGKPLRIAFLGQFSTGKSSVINGLLGTPVLPTSDLPLTSTVHRVSHATDGKGRHTVTFKDRETLHRDILDVLAQSGAKKPDFHELESAVERLAWVAQNLTTLRVDRSKARAISEMYRGIASGMSKWNHLLGGQQDWDHQTLSAVMSDPAVSFFIEQIHTQWDLPLLSAGAELWDIPGLGSMTAKHAEIAHRVAKTAHVVIYVMSAQHPFTTFDEERLASLLATPNPKSGLIICANKVDLADDPQACLDEIRRIFVDSLQRDGVETPPIVGMSGYLATVCRASREGHETALPKAMAMKYLKAQKDAPGLAHTDFEALSGIRSIESAIIEAIEKARGREAVAAIKDLIVEVRASVHKEKAAMRAFWRREIRDRKGVVEHWERRRDALQSQHDQTLQRFSADTSSLVHKAMESFRDQIEISRRRHVRIMHLDFSHYQAILGTRMALAYMDGEFEKMFHNAFSEETILLIQRTADSLQASLFEIVEKLEQDADMLEGDIENLVLEINERGQRRVNRSLPRIQSRPFDVQRKMQGSGFLGRLFLRMDMFRQKHLDTVAGHLDEFASSLVEDFVAQAESVMKAHAAEICAAAAKTFSSSVEACSRRLNTFIVQLESIQAERQRWGAALETFELSFAQEMTRLECMEWHE
jgi:hypothetical protein